MFPRAGIKVDAPKGKPCSIYVFHVMMKKLHNNEETYKEQATEIFS